MRCSKTVSQVDLLFIFVQRSPKCSLSILPGSVSLPHDIFVAFCLACCTLDSSMPDDPLHRTTRGFLRTKDSLVRVMENILDGFVGICSSL